ncbi:MAG: hypothetical protein JJT81_13040 [Rubellimicrobium sp.]|nr:hypothetical protein [Rubellimicrobium sp.]
MTRGVWSYCLNAGTGVDTPTMMRFFDMDDRARLPWRFHGAIRTVLARL